MLGLLQVAKRLHGGSHGVSALLLRRCDPCGHPRAHSSGHVRASRHRGLCEEYFKWHPGCFIAQSDYSSVDAARMLAEMPDKPDMGKR